MAHQINVFAQNQPGRLEHMTEVLTEAGVNIRAITISGVGDFGVVKLLADDPDLAARVLEGQGFSAFKKEVLAAVMDDRPGGLHRIFNILGRAGINVEDAYGFVVKDRETAVLLMELSGIAGAEKALVAEGVEILSDRELYEL